MMPKLICYCFGYSVADVKYDISINGRSTILERILDEKKTGGCQCKEKNPKGR